MMLHCYKINQFQILTVRKYYLFINQDIKGYFYYLLINSKNQFNFNHYQYRLKYIILLLFSHCPIFDLKIIH